MSNLEDHLAEQDAITARYEAMRGDECAIAFPVSHLVEIANALQDAKERLELNDCQGDESDYIGAIQEALARIYAAPGLLALIDR